MGNTNSELFLYAIVFCGFFTCATGWYTEWSLGKMGKAYGLGMTFIVLFSVPDWAFFMRSPAQWFTHLPIADNNGGKMGCDVNVVLEEEKKNPHQREGISADGTIKT